MEIGDLIFAEKASHLPMLRASPRHYQDTADPALEAVTQTELVLEARKYFYVRKEDLKPPADMRSVFFVGGAATDVIFEKVSPHPFKIGPDTSLRCLFRAAVPERWLVDEHEILFEPPQNTREEVLLRFRLRFRLRGRQALLLFYGPSLFEALPTLSVQSDQLLQEMQVPARNLLFPKIGTPLLEVAAKIDAQPQLSERWILVAPLEKFRMLR
jgi:hypothetical protein